MAVFLVSSSSATTAAASITSSSLKLSTGPSRMRLRPCRKLKNSLVAAAVSSTSNVSVDSLVEFLKEDLPHLFDEQGIDSSRYEERVEFRDPLNRHGSLSGYLFNIQLIRLVFDVVFILHKAQQTGANEITTRWTMNMKFKLLPWKPVLIFTGTSVMGINPETGKFSSHVDYWDSIKNNEFFSFEALLDVLKQMRPLKTPELETPTYVVLKRTSSYEVREYKSFLVAETSTEGLAGSKGFNKVAGYIFGKNQREEKMKMTTPVFNERVQEAVDKLQFVLPSQYELSTLPPPSSEEVSLKEVSKVLAAVAKFPGKTTEELVREKEKQLRADLLRDNLKPSPGYLLARYNDPDRTPSFLRRNEVLIWLEEFDLDV